METCAVATENEALPNHAVHSRWWLENTGAAPVGNMPVSVALRGDVLTGELGTVQVAVANNRASERFVGEVILTGPDGWAIEPAMVPVNLDPLGGTVFDVLVEAPPDSSGRLVASLADGGMTYFDISEIGEVLDPVVSVDIDEDKITARVENCTTDRMHFIATLITPIETWPEANAIVDGTADWPVAFRDRRFSLDPGATEEIVIPVPADFSRHAWAFVKVTYAGRARYHRVPVRLIAEKQSHSGAPIALSAPTADATIAVTTKVDAPETILRAEITRRTTPSTGCQPSPLDGVAKYWTIDKLDGVDAVESAELSVGVVPAELGVARSPSTVRLAHWRGDRWESAPTTFDERTRELRTSVTPEVLRETSHWTIVGETDVVWRTRVGGRFFESNPYVGDIDGDGSPEIVVGTAANEVVLLNAEGDVCWRRRFTGWIWPSPRIGCADIDRDGRQEIVVCTNDRTLALLDADGRIRWRRDDQPFAKKSAPAFGDINGDGQDEIVVSINEHGVWAWNADGESLWRTKLHTALLSAPNVVITDDGPAIFVNVAGKRLVRLDGLGEVVWERVFAEGSALARYAANPVVTTALRDRQEVLFAGHDGVLRLIDPDGEQVWQVDIGRPIVSAPVIVSANADGSQVLCVGSDGRMVWISPDGTIMREHHLSAPVQGAIVFADVDGDGVDEIVVGTSRTLQTVVMKQDGTEVACVPYGAIWEHAAAVESLADDARSAIIVGSADEYLVATVPTLNAQ
jgi:outer membrane protein assembly factor BamB